MYIAGIVFVCSEYEYEEKKSSSGYASSSRTASFSFYNTAVRTQTCSATSSQNILPCCSTGRTRRTAFRIQVGSITFWVSLLGHTYTRIFCMHTYIRACIHTYIYTHTHIYTYIHARAQTDIRMHAYIYHTYVLYIWRQSVKSPTFCISAPSRRWSEVLLVALPGSEFP